MTLRAGFARCDITPPLGLPLGGYGARVGGAESVLDPLCARTAWLDDGSTTIAIVALEVVYVSGAWVAQLRARLAAQLGIGPDHALIAATHTHSGPGVFRSSIEHDPRLVAYELDLLERVTAGVGAAQRSARPAQLRCGRAPTARIAANRRDPSITVDDTVRALSAHTATGELLGVIANYACHPTVLSAANHGYSGDLLGRAAIASTHALGAPVLLLNGAAGDVSTRFTRCAQTHDEARRMGHDLATAIAAGVRSATAVGATPLAAASETVPVRWRDLPSPEAAAAQLQSACVDLERLQAHGVDAGALRLAQSRLEGAQAELWVASHGGWSALFGERPPVAEVQALRCGEVAVVAAPGELFSAAGRWLSDHLDAPALVVGYANDYLGYLIPEAEARAGGYEALIAMVDPACEAAIRAGMLRAARMAGCRVQGSRA